MAIYGDDPEVIVSIAVLGGLILGFVMKHFYDERNAKNAPKGFNGKQIDAWHIPSEYATILLEKDPKQKAIEELDKLKQIETESDEKFKEIRNDLAKTLSEIETESIAIQSASTNAAKLAKANTLMPWFIAQLARYRRDTEFLIEATITLAWREHFLTLVKMNHSRDRIVSTMNKDGAGGHIKNPYSKNMALIESEWNAMTNDDAEWTNDLLTNLFGIQPPS